jgi:type VI secretion system protein ImpA
MLSALDIAALRKEISPGAPSGPDLAYDAAFVALEDKVKGTPEQQIGDRIEPAQPPNWRDVGKDAVELLTRTHDLRVLICLLRALVHTDGYAGFSNGLSLLREYIEKFWNSVHPQLDADDQYDPTQRVNILMSLCDLETLLRPLASAPLVESPAMGRFSLRDVQLASGKLQPLPGGAAAPSLPAIQAAFADCDLTRLQAVHDAIATSLSDVAAIEAAVTERVGPANAPDFSALGNLLKEARHILGEQLIHRGVGIAPLESEAPPAAPDAAPAVSDTPPAGALGGAINDRQDVIHALDLICAYYSRCEPSSPVPLLLQRARRLVSKDFLEILQDLAPDGLAQVQVIKGPDAA